MSGAVSDSTHGKNYIIQKEKPQLSKSPNRQMQIIEEKAGVKSPKPASLTIKKNLTNIQSPSSKAQNFNF